MSADAEGVYQIFQKFTKGNGNLDYVDARGACDVFKELGYFISESDMFSLLGDLSYSMRENDDAISTRSAMSYHSEKIDYFKFLQLFQIFKTQKENEGSEEDLVDAFIALGGNKNKSGYINISQINDLCLKFGLSFDIISIAKEANITVEDGKLDYFQFKSIMSNEE
ncbi:hypothetical protein ABK040_000179 [Willaertia magna]